MELLLRSTMPVDLDHQRCCLTLALGALAVHHPLLAGRVWWGRTETHQFSL